MELYEDGEIIQSHDDRIKGNNDLVVGLVGKVSKKRDGSGYITQWRPAFITQKGELITGDLPKDEWL